MKAARKLIPAIALLLVAVVLMSSASFAWFTMSREVTANSMNVNVIAPNNLVISDALDGDYSDTATISLAGANYVEPASTVDAETFYTLDTSVDSATGKRLATSSYTAVDVDDNTALAGTQAAPKAFVDFQYFIQTEGDTAVPVRIKTVTVAKHEGSTGGTDNGLKAVRFALIDTYVATQTGAAATDVADEFICVPAGSAYATAGYALASAGVIGAQAADETATTGAKATGKIAEVPAIVYGDTDTPTNNTTVFSVAADAISVITIRVWLEGEDTMCTVNEAAKLNFDLTVVFEAVA